jgi:predicted transcriptional regulator
MIGRVEKKIEMLERHLDVLGMVIANEPIGIVRTANELGHPHHKIRYSFRILEEEGLIESSPQGAITTERTNETVGDFNERLAEIRGTLEELAADTDDERTQRIVTAQH